MKIRIALLLALAALVAFAGIAAARPDIPPIVDDVLWVVKCAGDALGGHACHGP